MKSKFYTIFIALLLFQFPTEISCTGKRTIDDLEDGYSPWTHAIPREVWVEIASYLKKRDLCSLLHSCSTLYSSIPAEFNYSLVFHEDRNHFINRCQRGLIRGLYGVNINGENISLQNTFIKTLKASNLTYLIMRPKCTLTEEIVKALQLPTLTRLHLPLQADFTANEILKLSQLKELTLDISDEILETDRKILIEFVNQLTVLQLTSLAVSTYFGDDDDEDDDDDYLAQPILDCDLDENENLARDFFRACNLNTDFKALHLDNFPLSTTGYELNEFAQNTTLQELKISQNNSENNELPSTAVDNLRNFLKTNTTLKVLEIVRQNLKDIHLMQIAETLRDYNTTLQILDLSDNRFTIDGHEWLDNHNAYFQYRILHNYSIFDLPEETEGESEDQDIKIEEESDTAEESEDDTQILDAVIDRL